MSDCIGGVGERVTHPLARVEEGEGIWKLGGPVLGGLHWVCVWVCVCVQVTKRERVVAERYYLTRFSSQWAESRGGAEERRREFEVAHPRFAKLADSKR